MWHLTFISHWFSLTSSLQHHLQCLTCETSTCIIHSVWYAGSRLFIPSSTQETGTVKTQAQFQSFACFHSNGLCCFTRCLLRIFSLFLELKKFWIVIKGQHYTVKTKRDLHYLFYQYYYSILIYHRLLLAALSYITVLVCCGYSFFNCCCMRELLNYIWIPFTGQCQENFSLLRTHLSSH